MSIRVPLQKRLGVLVGQKKIYHLECGLPGVPNPRTIFVTRAIYGDVADPWSSEDRRMGDFRAVLDNFTEGWEISVSEKPFDKDPQTILARVNPIPCEVWDLRVYAPTPQIRCFGRFLGKDCFMALSWNDRDLVDGNWDPERDECIEIWDELFSPFEPHIGGSLDDYLSNYRIT